MDAWLFTLFNVLLWTNFRLFCAHICSRDGGRTVLDSLGEDGVRIGSSCIRDLVGSRENTVRQRDGISQRHCRSTSQYSSFGQGDDQEALQIQRCTIDFLGGTRFLVVLSSIP